MTSSMPMAPAAGRMTLHARQSQQDVLRVGFAAAGRHEIIAIDHCPILDPAMHGAIEAANEIAELLRVRSASPLDIQITAADNGLDVAVRGSGPLGTGLLASLSKACREAQSRAAHPPWRTGRHAQAAGGAGRQGASHIAARLVHAAEPALVEETLAALAFERCKGAKHIADLFCGFGPFAFRLAEKFKVAAFDSDAGRGDRRCKMQ
jgi:23S rRNA (uracil1939-C5)-methyltransferase